VSKEQSQIAALGEALAVVRSGGGSGSEGERERLERIMDLLPCYVALIDENHRVLYHNAVFAEYFGTPGDRPCYTVLRGQDAPCFFCPSFTALKGRGRANVTEWAHPGNRQAFRVHSHPFTDIDGTPCVLEAGFNVTASVRVQQALDLSEKSYRAITDNLTIGIALLDPELHIKAGNARLSQWFNEGFRLDRRICGLLRCGSNWAAAEQGEFCPECPFKESGKDGQAREKEFSVAFQDGTERHMRMVTCPVMSGKGQSGRIRAMILMLEDITNRLRVNRQLQQARKLEAMNTLAGGIAHEINQPLSALHLYASGLQMLLEKPGDLPQETTQERLGLIMREADKIRSIISHMRSLATREGRVELAPVSLSGAVESVRGLMRQRLEAHGVELAAEIPQDLPLVQANDLQLEQVLVNLVSNAIQVMSGTSGDKYIRIRAYPVPETGRIRLEVADSGPGLPPGGERIFDPFFTTKERHEGMGLGLSISHALVSLWGGAISAAARHPELGGAVFYVDLLP
jgi:signal transduction histidine kinase